MMPDEKEFIVKYNSLTVEEFSRLFTSAGWILSYSEEQIKSALEGCLCVVSIHVGDEAVAMGRVFGDGATSFFFKDIIVAPQYQGHRLGTRVLDELINFIKGQIPKGWQVMVDLMSAKGKEGFYEKYGFTIRPNEQRGSGVTLYLSND